MMKRNCKKQYTLKSTVLISTLFIVTGAFTACGKADHEDIEKDLSANVTSDYATGSDGLQEKIPETLSYTVGGSNGEIKVEAEVYAEGYGNVPVYKLKKRDKNDRWVKSYAEKLFDNGEYINVKPYDVCSLEELEAEKYFWEERLAALDESSSGYRCVDSEISHIKQEMEHFSERNHVKYPEGQLVFESDRYGDGDKQAGYSESAQLRGEVDGDVWLLNYSCAYDYNVQEDIREIVLHAPVLYGSCVEKKSHILGAYGTEYELYENKCDWAKAESEAIKLLDRLGFDNMECVKTLGLLPDYGSGNADDLDGYAFIYKPSLNDIKMFSGVKSGVSADGENIAIQPYVSVLVNSEGAFSFCIMEDYVFEGTLSENSQMLSFQQIDDIARTEFEKMMEWQPTNAYDIYTSCNITKVRFEYLCVTYDRLSYVMLPVWTYYTERSSHGYTKLYPVLIVNGLDGAIIDSAYVYSDWEYCFTVEPF